MADLSTNVGSSLSTTPLLADNMTHISHRFIFTVRNVHRFKGDPYNDADNLELEKNAIKTMVHEKQ